METNIEKNRTFWPEGIKRGKHYKLWCEGIQSGTGDVTCPKYFTKEPTIHDIAKINEYNLFEIIEYSEYAEVAFPFSCEAAANMIPLLEEYGGDYGIEEVVFATRDEVDRLKDEWYRDGIWDLEKTAMETKYYPYKKELLEFKEQVDAQFEAEKEKREIELKQEAENLGVAGIYKLLKEHEELIERQRSAIELLAQEEPYQALRALAGYTE